MDAPEYIGGRGYGERDCQPDLAFCLGESFSLPPQDNAPIDVNCIWSAPGLKIALVEEALGRSQTEDDGTLMRWLMDTFQSINR
jgi:hypothetical protein